MAVLAAVGEGETGGVGETVRRAVNDLGDQGERLKGSRSELFQEQKFGEAVEIALVGDRQHGSQALEIDILLTDFVMSRHAETVRGFQSLLRIFAGDVEGRLFSVVC